MISLGIITVAQRAKLPYHGTSSSFSLLFISHFTFRISPFPFLSLLFLFLFLFLSLFLFLFPFYFSFSYQREHHPWSSLPPHATPVPVQYEIPTPGACHFSLGRVRGCVLRTFIPTVYSVLRTLPVRSSRKVYVDRCDLSQAPISIFTPPRQQVRSVPPVSKKFLLQPSNGRQELSQYE